MPKGVQTLILTILIPLSLVWQNRAHAQETTGGGGGATRSYFDIGAKSGSLLPYGIEGVRDLLPMWGIRLGHPVSQSMAIEYDVDAAIGKGVTYYLGYISLRYDFSVASVIPIYMTIGFDGHYFKRKDSVGEITGNITEFDFRFTTGWHLGFGSETQVVGDLYFRADVRLGSGPGRQLSANLGFVFRL